MTWTRYSIHAGQIEFNYTHANVEDTLIEISILQKPYHLDIDFHDINEECSENYVSIEYSNLSEEDIWSTLVILEKDKLLPKDTQKIIFDELIKPTLQRPRKAAIGGTTLYFHDLENFVSYVTDILPFELIIPLVARIPVVKTGKYPTEKELPYIHYVHESKFIRKYTALYNDLRKLVIREGTRLEEDEEE